jgi:hypothetical protein
MESDYSPSYEENGVGATPSLLRDRHDMRHQLLLMTVAKPGHRV